MSSQEKSEVSLSDLQMPKTQQEAFLPQKIRTEKTEFGGEIQRIEAKWEVGKVHGKKAETQRRQIEESAAVCVGRLMGWTEKDSSC